MITLTSAGREPAGRAATTDPLPFEDASGPAPAARVRVGNFIEAGSLPGRHGVVRAAAAGAQRAVARSSRGPLRSVWRLLYKLAARLYAAWVCPDRSVSAYARGSMGRAEAVYGISDIDMVFVFRGEAGEARKRARRRARAVARVPLLAALFDHPAFHTQAELAAASGGSTFTHGLEEPAPAVYHGPGADQDALRLLERPQPTAGWRLLRGRDLRPVESERDRARSGHASWLELQYWWRCAVEGALAPGAAWVTPLCSKLVAEPARSWLWLARGVRAGDRADALERAAAELPGEAAAFDAALAFEHARGAQASLDLALGGLLRLSHLIAAELAAQASGAGYTAVRLVDGELALPHGGWPAGAPAGAPLQPLADWRAVVCPLYADDASALLDGDPSDPATLAALARRFVTSAHPALRAGDLIVRPLFGGLARLRTLQSPLTDPVSFALEAGAAEARFANAPGWSAADWSRRAVAEHGAWLCAGVEPAGRSLGLLALAARAALFHESLEAGEPRLALTASAALRLLSERDEGARPAAERAWEEYRRWAVDWNSVPEAAVRDLERAVRKLPAYARGGR